MTYAFLDTSIFMHYKVFEGMPWKNIISDKDIIFVVPQKVVDEIDKHKDSTKTRLRKRAMQVNKYLLGYLDGNKPTSLNIVFCPNPSSEMTNRKDFDSSSADEYIVFSAYEYDSAENRKIIVSADTGMKLRAAKVKSEVIIPDIKFRLSEEKTDEETRIQQLEKQLASYQKTYAKPKLTFINGETELNYNKVKRPDFSKREIEIRKELKSKFPNRPYPKADSNNSLYGISIPLNYPPLYYSQEAYDRYNAILPEFYEKETLYQCTEELAAFLNDNMIPLSFEISNIGNAKSGKLGLYLSFPQNIKIYCEENKKTLSFNRITPPQILPIGHALFDLNQMQHYTPPIIDDYIDLWDTKNPINLNKCNDFFYHLSPVIHNMPPKEVIKNEFYIYLGTKQEFEIKWKLCDELSPNTEEGILKISVS